MAQIVRKIGGIVFDLDGVLIDSCGAVEGAVRRAITSLALPWREEILEILFKNHRDVFSRVYSERKELTEKFHGLYTGDAAHYEGVLLQPGAREILDFLKSLGLRAAIATTKDGPRTMKILAHFGLALDAVVTSDDTIVTRPDPAPIFLALEKAEIAKDEVLYVGDTPLDVVQARNAGVSCAGITTGKFSVDELAYEKPDFIIAGLLELKNIVEKTNGV